jgi:hypothetical protein
MADVVVIAEFVFVANKSFVGIGNRPITVPARYYQGFKQNGLIMESVHATIAFRGESMFKGYIRVGIRAGGKYYQITLPKSQTNIVINDIKIGTRLFVRVLKTPQDWMIEII